MDDKLRKTFIYAFSFLWEQHNFILLKDESTKWSYMFEAKNKFVGIRVIYEYREAFVNVIIFRLINGEIVDNTTQAILNNETINGFSLNHIILMQNPDDIIEAEYANNGVNEKNDLLNYLSKISMRLEIYANSIFNGNFDLFNKLDEIVKKDYRQYYNKK